MKMNINQLIEKYWNAETNLQEEAELRAYFSSDDVAPEHEQYKDLFTFFSVSRLQSTNLDVEDVLSTLSDIDLVLEKFWKAETSLEEEAQLRAYFNSDSVAPEHMEHKDLFVYYEVSKSQTTDLDIEAVLSQSSSIDDILEKYWNAETSLEEENQLKSYFAGNDVAAEHEAYRGLFDMYAIKASETTDLNLAEILRNAEESEGNPAIGSPVMPGASKAKVFSLQRWVSGIAAVFVLGFAAVTVMNQSSVIIPETQYKGQTTVLDEEAEAQEAYEITKEALAFLSKNMNKGSKTALKSVAKAEKVNIFK